MGSHRNYTNHAFASEMRNQQTARAAERAASDAAQFGARLEVAEYMIQIMWKMLQERGATEEELFAGVQEIYEKNIGKYNKTPKYYCPRCGKIMQIGNKNPFTANCMYCSAEMMIYPYANKDDINPEEATDGLKGEFSDDSLM